MARLMELNADVGEGWDDSLIFPYVDRVSIACGGHAGDEASMRLTLLLARDMGVLAGAHPGYPDRQNFGRKPVATHPGDVRRWVLEQSRELMRLAEQEGTRLFHVKPHGALYSLVAQDEATGREVIAALLDLGGLALVCLAGSPLAGWARGSGLAVLEEAFADRRYLADGSLAPRDGPGAVIDEPGAAADQARRIAVGEAITTLDGGILLLRADTLCLHGDRPDAVNFARSVAAALAA
ncbi:MAG TPA: 5-oxoprolinase subunit PxpA [Thiobacillaceae bacterium]|nr:5-oxoprolinase subunit PxpA [Thiobacillaceae bacterium]